MSCLDMTRSLRNVDIVFYCYWLCPLFTPLQRALNEFIATGHSVRGGVTSRFCNARQLWSPLLIGKLARFPV